MQVLEDPVRFLNVAFVMTALTLTAPHLRAEDGISPEVFAVCEAKTPNDFKQQLACVKEQVQALDGLKDLKQPKSRQIVVQPKIEDKNELDTGAVVDVANATVEDFCKRQSAGDGGKVDWKTCVENETAAQKAIAAALDAVDSDIPGDPYFACQNYITAYQTRDKNAYISQVHMVQCLKAKAPTRDFGRCYQNFEQRIFNREVTSVSVENAGYVAGCFVSTLAGGP
jgi:hypothetical protein